jgi:hypothetical protein
LFVTQQSRRLGPRGPCFNYTINNRLATAQTTSTHATSPSHCWGETYQYDGVTNGAWGDLTQIAATTNSAWLRQPPGMRAIECDAPTSAATATGDTGGKSIARQHVYVGLIFKVAYG